MSQGRTLKYFAKRAERLERAYQLIDGIHTRLVNSFGAAVERYDEARRQAIADRQAAIRVASEEISLLESM